MTANEKLPATGHKPMNPWKWGIFYYNPDDNRLFPPKRIPWLGWTINFANPKSIAAFFVVLTVLLSGSWVLQYFFH